MKFKTFFPGTDGYPALLRNIYDPPKKLYVWGQFPDFDLHPPVAVIGSRKPTDYGQKNAHELAGKLAEAGFTIVSGLAYGVDSIAHRACLEKGGVTVAVIGSGLDRIYPEIYQKLAEQIVDTGGAVISEYELGTAPLPFNFPKRNRIISGMSLGTVVVEAAVDSGSLITARSALEQGREVFAVPGPIGNVNTAGTHRLIRDGAALLDSAQDVIDILENKLPHAWKTKFAGQSFGIGDKERKILDHLGSEPQLTDILLDKCGLALPEILSALTQLECAGLIKDKDGRGYVKLRSLT